MGIAKEALNNLFKKPSTKKYPYQKIETFEKFRGEISFDKSKCIGCGLCRTFCPSECIKLGWKKKKIVAKGIEHQSIIHPIQEINIGKCMSCGLCVDVCPVKCIRFTQYFELASKDKNKLITEGI